MVKDKKDPNIEKAGIWQDPRFTHLVSDPRFHTLPKSARKVKIDSRFQSMFSNDKFRVKYSIDKYGRKVNKSSTEDLKKYYELNSSSDEEQENEEIRKETVSIAKDESISKNDALEDDSESVPSSLLKKLNESGVDYARGEGRILTDSSSDDDSTDDEDNELVIDHVWGELDIDAPKTDESTSRLAACNMDWDRIRASDIMVLCNSFLPPGGTILSVKIYPSQFGKQRLAEEEVHGPPELTKGEPTKGSDSDTDQELAKEMDSDAEEGDDYHMEKLRQYQLTRLKYYYAVIECDSIETADKLYAECDGIEYESTATKLDLRFIADDINFDEDEPKDSCTEVPDLNKYQPRLFTTTALQQAKVELTWDETNVERKELGDKLSSGKLTDLNDADLRKIIVYSSDEESDDKESSLKDTVKEHCNGKDSISKYKSLLQEINKKESEKAKNKFEMEYSWGINVENKKPANKVSKKPVELTPIEKALAKKSEKNKRRKEERRKRIQGSDKEDTESSDDLPSDVDLTDRYFAEEFASGDFEKPKKKANKTKLTKLKHSDKTDDQNDDDEQKSKELQLLLDDCQDNDKQHFNLKQIQEAENKTKSKKRRKKLKKSRQEINSSKSKLVDTFEVNVKDDRFQSIYTSHMFNIDPTDPHYKKTKGMESIIQEKFRRRQERIVAGGNGDEEEADPAPKRPRKNLENAILIKNIKKKIMQNQN